MNNFVTKRSQITKIVVSNPTFSNYFYFHRILLELMVYFLFYKLLNFNLVNVKCN